MSSCTGIWINTARSEWAIWSPARPKISRHSWRVTRLIRTGQDLSVSATIAGKLWDQLEERFPLAYNDLFKRYISGKDIPQSYAMAIARVRRAPGIPVASSPVGATGLMQISMPGTATHK